MDFFRKLFTRAATARKETGASARRDACIEGAQLTACGKIDPHQGAAEAARR
jgi:hypothetical protein